MAHLKSVDEKRVIELASKGYLIKEIAALENVSYPTLHRRFKSAYDKGQELLRGQLRAAQVKSAIGDPETGAKPNPIMLIWLGKQLLNQADKREDSLDIKRTTIVRMVGIAPNELEALAGSKRPQLEYSDAEIVEERRYANDQEQEIEIPAPNGNRSAQSDADASSEGK